MELTSEQFLYLCYAIIGGVTTAWVISFLCLRKQPEVLTTVLSEGGYGLRMFTVFFTLLAGTVLALVGKLSAEITAILAGVAGYVLGGMQKPSGKERP